MHNNRCQLAGKTINQWLAKPEQIADFLDILQQKQWIRRHQAPEQSPFWRMIAEEHGKMFGVFNAIEKQWLYDWIKGDLPATPHSHGRLTSKQRTVATPRTTTLAPNVMQQDTQFDRIETVRRLISPAQHHRAEGLAATHYFTQHLFPYLLG